MDINTVRGVYRCDSLRTPQTTETLQQLSFDPWKPVEKHFEDDHGLQTKQVELLETISGKLDTLNESKTTEMEAPPAENVELSELLKGLQESQNRTTGSDSGNFRKHIVLSD